MTAAALGTSRSALIAASAGGRSVAAGRGTDEPPPYAGQNGDAMVF
ncbi:hypothetical protein [Arthrobacter alkaliphilus]|nr:hypothetical protein [Arthrobacter alkaliphilus]